MISFKQFVTEQFSHTFTNFEFTKELSAFRKDAQDNVLFRGIKIRDSDTLFKFPHPTARTPKDSSQSLVCMFNSMIDAAHNIKDIRSHTLFCTGREAQAEQYGDLYEIVPIGEYKFIWSKYIADSYTGEHNIWRTLTEAFENLYGDVKIEALMTALPKLFTYMSNYTKSSSWVHDSSQDENIVKLYNLCKLDPLLRNGTAEGFPKILKEALTITGKELYRNGGSISEAILSKREILIYESSGYFAISTGDNI